MNVPVLLIAAGVGLVLQLAMVFAGHRNAFVREYVFAVGGMVVSLCAGLIYGRLAGEPWIPTLLGAAAAGGGCALAAIAVSVALKDAPAAILLIGTLGSAVTGVIGGALGRMLVF